MFLRGFRHHGRPGAAIRWPGWGCPWPERGRSTTYPRVFAADLLQMQQRSVEGVIFDCGRGQTTGPCLGGIV